MARGGKPCSSSSSDEDCAPRRGKKEDKEKDVERVDDRRKRVSRDRKAEYDRYENGHRSSSQRGKERVDNDPRERGRYESQGFRSDRYEYPTSRSGREPSSRSGMDRSYGHREERERFHPSAEGNRDRRRSDRELLDHERETRDRERDRDEDIREVASRGRDREHGRNTAENGGLPTRERRREPAKEDRHRGPDNTGFRVRGRLRECAKYERKQEIPREPDKENARNGPGRNTPVESRHMREKSPSRFLRDDTGRGGREIVSTRREGKDGGEDRERVRRLKRARDSSGIEEREFGRGRRNASPDEKTARQKWNIEEEKDISRGEEGTGKSGKPRRAREDSSDGEEDSRRKQVTRVRWKGDDEGDKPVSVAEDESGRGGKTTMVRDCSSGDEERSRRRSGPPSLASPKSTPPPRRVLERTGITEVTPKLDHTGSASMIAAAVAVPERVLEVEGGNLKLQRNHAGQVLARRASPSPKASPYFSPSESEESDVSRGRRSESSAMSPTPERGTLTKPHRATPDIRRGLRSPNPSPLSPRSRVPSHGRLSPLLSSRDSDGVSLRRLAKDLLQIDNGAAHDEQNGGEQRDLKDGESAKDFDLEKSVEQKRSVVDDKEEGNNDV